MNFAIEIHVIEENDILFVIKISIKGGEIGDRSLHGELIISQIRGLKFHIYIKLLEILILSKRCRGRQIV